MSFTESMAALWGAEWLHGYKYRKVCSVESIPEIQMWPFPITPENAFVIATGAMGRTILSNRYGVSMDDCTVTEIDGLTEVGSVYKEEIRYNAAVMAKLDPMESAAVSASIENFIKADAALKFSKLPTNNIYAGYGFFYYGRTTASEFDPYQEEFWTLLDLFDASPLDTTKWQSDIQHPEWSYITISDGHLVLTEASDNGYIEVTSKDVYNKGLYFETQIIINNNLSPENGTRVIVGLLDAFYGNKGAWLYVYRESNVYHYKLCMRADGNYYEEEIANNYVATELLKLKILWTADYRVIFYLDDVEITTSFPIMKEEDLHIMFRNYGSIYNPLIKTEIDVAALKVEEGITDLDDDDIIVSEEQTVTDYYTADDKVPPSWWYDNPADTNEEAPTNVNIEDECTWKRFDPGYGYEDNIDPLMEDI